MNKLETKKTLGLIKLKGCVLRRPTKTLANQSEEDWKWNQQNKKWTRWIHKQPEEIRVIRTCYDSYMPANWEHKRNIK